MVDRKPTVSRLHIHLQDNQIVKFDPNNRKWSLEKLEQSKRTKLTAFFELCSEENDIAHTLLYQAIPEYYTWNPEKRIWKRRKEESVDEIPEIIGLIYSIHPTIHCLQK